MSTWIEAFVYGLIDVSLLALACSVALVIFAPMAYAMYRRMLCLIVGVPMGVHASRRYMGVFDV